MLSAWSSATFIRRCSRWLASGYGSIPMRAELTEDEFRSAIPGAIDTFVRRALDRSKLDGEVWSTLERHEALDMLNQLIIRDGSLARRNSVAESALLEEDSPLRSRALRETILDALEKARLVRREMRLGGWYVEIVHERLIDAVQHLADYLRRNETSQTYPFCWMNCAQRRGSHSPQPALYRAGSYPCFLPTSNVSTCRRCSLRAYSGGCCSSLVF